MTLTGSEIIIRYLTDSGIPHVAGIPGGSNLPLYKALGQSKLKHILARHEQGAGFIAQGVARITGKPAVCFATSGPGATNLITALADAKLDSIPVVAITGQVPSFLLGTDAFQEVDTYGMTLPFCKHSYAVRSAAELITVLPEAFALAGSGRPGPVVIDVPKDVQNQSAEFSGWPEPVLAEKAPALRHKPTGELYKKAADLIASSVCPVLYIGGGIIHSGAEKEIRELAEKSRIPVTATLMGLGAFPCDHPLYIGMLGMHGSPYTNYLLRETDLLIAAGVRFDDRATGKLEEFCPDAKIIHIDIDPSEINKIRRADAGFQGDARPILAELTRQTPKAERKEWNARVEELRRKHPYPWPDRKNLTHPVNWLRLAGEILPPEAIVVTDVGQHQMWTAQVYPFRKPRTLLTSGGLGTMGFGLPTALGAALAAPDTPVICVTGDGSLMMNIQELATMAEEDLDVKVLVMNNGYLGLVRQQQELFYEKIYSGCTFFKRTDFAAAARAFGVPGYDLTGEKDPEKVFAEILKKKGPALINIPVRDEENVYPMVPPGAGNHVMLGER
jgi:acetolactate synthase-1/2/3 large subunit